MSTNADQSQSTGPSPWRWLPTLYFAQGLPYTIVIAVSVVMYTRLGLSNADIALYTSWLYLPWVIKPFWSPLVDMFATRRSWILVTQFLIGAALAGVALTIPGPEFLRYSLAFLWLLAFSSATYDIAADGFYMLALSEHDQAWFVGIRSTFYRLAWISGQGLLVMLAGYLETTADSIPLAWSLTLMMTAGLLLGVAAWHWRSLPRPATDVAKTQVSVAEGLRTFIDTFGTFFRQPQIVPILAFLLLFRFAEAQLARLSAPFMLDARETGGLGLSTVEQGLAFGTIGTVALTLGGILGGLLAARDGLKSWLWWMAVAINLPNVVYVLLAVFQPESFAIVTAGVAVEQFGYGFGFTAFTLYMIYVAAGPSKTSHYAICTGFMALGMMLPGMFSGFLQEALGYRSFFVWVLVATIPSFIVTGLIPVEASFGRKE